MRFEECSERSRNKIVTAEENGKKLTIRNPKRKRINRVTVDNCLIKGDKKRCDYLFEINEPMDKIFYLELKGKNIKKAYEQLVSTVDFCKKRHGEIHKQCYIISSRVPQSGTDVNVLKRKMQQKHNIQLFVKTKEHTLNI